MKPNLFIKYKGKDEEFDSCVDLVSLGESIAGFDTVIKDIFRISKMNGEISVQASKIREGSLIVDIIVFVSNISNNIPFERIADFLNFLKIVNNELFNTANQFFNTIETAHRELNEFAKEYPATYDIVKTGLTLFIGVLIGKATKHKKHPDLNDLPEEYAKDLYKMINNKKFKKAVKPFIEDEIQSIEISNERSFINKARIDVNNFEGYLGEDDQILPELLNGQIHSLQGKVVGMQCSRGDSMKIKVINNNQKNITLIAYPPKGKTTKDFDEFYGQDVVFKAEIIRTSLYQKPKLNIINIDIQQKSIFDFID